MRHAIISVTGVEHGNHNRPPRLNTFQPWETSYKWSQCAAYNIDTRRIERFSASAPTLRIKNPLAPFTKRAQTGVGTTPGWPPQNFMTPHSWHTHQSCGHQPMAVGVQWQLDAGVRSPVFRRSILPWFQIGEGRATKHHIAGQQQKSAHSEIGGCGSISRLLENYSQTRTSRNNKPASALGLPLTQINIT